MLLMCLLDFHVSTLVRHFKGALIQVSRSIPDHIDTGITVPLGATVDVPGEVRLYWEDCYCSSDF